MRLLTAALSHHTPGSSFRGVFRTPPDRDRTWPVMVGTSATPSSPALLRKRLAQRLCRDVRSTKIERRVRPRPHGVEQRDRNQVLECENLLTCNPAITYTRRSRFRVSYPECLVNICCKELNVLYCIGFKATTSQHLCVLAASSTLAGKIPEAEIRARDARELTALMCFIMIKVSQCPSCVHGNL